MESVHTLLSQYAAEDGTLSKGEFKKLIQGNEQLRAIFVEQLQGWRSLWSKLNISNNRVNVQDILSLGDALSQNTTIATNPIAAAPSTNPKAEVVSHATTTADDATHQTSDDEQASAERSLATESQPPSKSQESTSNKTLDTTDDAGSVDSWKVALVVATTVVCVAWTVKRAMS
eukprot:m.223447 g.223447  ORF g.223447 m.223447 type:complete len:174 (+) comp17269_c0_seq1:2126-2647(+)